MKSFTTLLRSSLLFLLFIGCSAAFSANTTQKVSQVTSAVTLSDAVDYVITGSSPFASGGSVDITNTEHAVLIIQGIKPSQVISKHLNTHVFINGEQAVDGVNCQVKRYAMGTIIFPYPKNFRPLTVFSEKNFEGTSADNFGLEHSGGFMNTLSAAQLNNQIHSFKLKRGYMVTFATGKSGWGYSRCFIADTEDLEIAVLPDVLDGTITSYRVFSWFYASKKGLASDTDAGRNGTLNSSWCYDWAAGVNRLPDVECVPNHIYEDWPSPSACGSVTYATMMKTNNEPGNSADDHPQDVETVLNNWQNLMRTGLRLCSETSHDGSWGHLQQFIAAIDARGWRCDLLDLHCYWSGGFNNMQSYYNNYGKRPIVISEWVWGASWNNNGIFATDRSFSKANQQLNKDHLVGILSDLENSPYVERYAYWNSEADCSKLIRGSEVSIAGQYYADLKSNMGYNKAYEKIPNVVYTKPEGLTGEWNKKTGTYKISWNDSNGDIIKSVQVLRKNPGSKTYETIATLDPLDLNGKTVTYNYTDTLTEAGAYYYQVVNVGPNNRKLASDDEVSVTVAAAQSASGMQFGELTITNTEAVEVNYSEPFDTIPAVFIGIPSNSNANVGLSRKVSSVSKNKFSFAFVPWINGSSSEFAKAETVDFLAMPYGSKVFDDGQQYEIGSGKATNTETEIVFEKPFPEGVTPIVIVEMRPTLSKPLLTKVWDITNTGFKVVVKGEEKEGLKIVAKQNFAYLAITPGETRLGNGKKFYAGIGENPLYGKTYKQEHFLLGEDTLMVQNPLVFGATQENNTEALGVLRRVSDMTQTGEDGETYVVGMRIKKQVDETTSAGYTAATTGEAFGWVLLVDDDGPVDAVRDIISDRSGMPLVKVDANRRIVVSGAYELFTASGTKVAPGSSLAPGVYLVKVGKKTTKVVVR
ncbi:MAG: hypothetical protein IKH26_13675 [Bacteroidaceae bacterium]|nr:hypothetical protein [Bacteroidaceae bacterium]